MRGFGNRRIHKIKMPAETAGIILVSVNVKRLKLCNVNSLRSLLSVNNFILNGSALFKRLEAFHIES